MQTHLTPPRVAFFITFFVGARVSAATKSGGTRRQKAGRISRAATGGLGSNGPWHADLRNWDARQVLAFLESNLQELDVRSVISCLSRLGRLGSTMRPHSLCNSKPFANMLHRLSEWVSAGHVNTESLRSVLLATTYLDGQHALVRDLCQQCSQDLVSNAKKASPQDLAAGAWSLAQQGVLDPEVFCRIAHESLATSSHFELLDVQKLLWAFAKLDVKDEGLFRSFARVVVSHQRSLSSQGMSNLAWAYATSSVTEEDFLHAIEQGSTFKLREFEPQGLSNLVWAYATLHGGTEALYRAVVKETLVRIDDFKPMELRSLAWAFASVALEAPVLLEALGKAAVRGAHECSATSLCSLAWSFGTASVYSSALFKEIARLATSRAEEYDADELSTLAWAFAKVKALELDLFHAIAREVRKRTSQFTPRALASQVAWAFATLRIKDEDLFHALALQAISDVKEFDVQGLSNIAWAFSNVGIEANELFKAVSFTSTAALDTFDPQGISNLALAFAKLALLDELLFTGLASKAVHLVRALKPQDLANLAWAFSTLRMDATELFDAIEEELSVRLSCVAVDKPSGGASAVEAVDIKDIVWSFGHAGRPLVNLLRLAGGALRMMGRELDGVFVVPTSLVAPPKSGPVGDVPSVVLDLEDRWVVYKPSGWEVERSQGQESQAPPGGAAAGSNAKQLSEHLRGLSPRGCPILDDASHSFGFLHRLDVSSSGLILAARSYEAYHDLGLQLRAGSLARDYVVLCHGLLPAARGRVSARVGVDPGTANFESAPSTVKRAGKTATTKMKVLARLSLENEVFTLLAVRIVTGRRHQIRAHTAHIGHPVVCDWMYAPCAFESDKSWCKRNFLHRYRLAFHDRKGSLREVSEPLPSDLAKTLQRMSPLDASSADMLKRWQTGSGCLDWELYDALLPLNSS